jgi:hypothetical protein
MGLSKVRLRITLYIGYTYAKNIQSTLRDHRALISSNGKHQVIVQEAIDYIIMPEYLATRKEGIAHFIYKVIPLLSIDADKETVREVIKQYMSKVCNTYARYMLYLCLQ